MEGEFSKCSEQVLYCPNFVFDMYNTTQFPVNQTKKVLAQKNWVTTDLSKEVMTYYPKRDQIDVTNGNARDKEAFAENAEKMFFVG